MLKKEAWRVTAYLHAYTPVPRLSDLITSHCNTNRGRAILFVPLISALLLTATPYWRLDAQVTKASQQGLVHEESSDDPLGRSTPRGTVLGFLKAANHGDYDEAASYLDTKQHGELARQLAQQLQTILDHQTTIDLSSLNRRSDGSLGTPETLNRELVGFASTPSGKLEIYLDRVERDDNPPIWLFSQDTLRHVPEVYQDIGAATPIEQYLPRWLRVPLLVVPLWTLCALLISILVVVLLGSLSAGLVKSLLRRLLVKMIGETRINQAGFTFAVQLTLVGILVLFTGNFATTLLGRSYWRDAGTVLVVSGGTWLLVKTIGITAGIALARLRRVGSFDKIALAGLAGRLSQIGVFTIGLFLALSLAGVNLTAALTGLGIGGLAIAFAAQKTLENLFGGLMIISDRPVRIGDFCRIGEVSGTITDIGLRSTQIRTQDRTVVTIPNGQLATMDLENYSLRDKFWFHPALFLRQETTSPQMEAVLCGIRELLKRSDVEPTTSWVRLTSIGTSSQNVDVFAYVLAADYEAFLAIQEQLLMRILAMVESSGASLALPVQITRVIREPDPNPQTRNEVTV